MAEKLLIVNADDFGARDDVSNGIVAAHLEGLVKSTSLLVNSPGTEYAARLARDTPTLEVGLHLNISQGPCISPARDVSLLVDETGTFWFGSGGIERSLLRLRDMADRHELLIEQVSIEFDNQVARFRELGLRLGHINIHHYLSLLHPRLFEVYVAAAERAGVAFRGICRPMLDILNTPGAEVAQMIEISKRAKSPSPDLSVSNLSEISVSPPDADIYLQMMTEHLAGLAGDARLCAVELITHPADMSSAPPEDDGYAWARSLETNLVRSQEFRDSVLRQGYVPGSYADLSAPQEGWSFGSEDD